MDEGKQTFTNVLYVIACAAPPAQRIQEFVVLAQAAGWDVCVIATPQALKNT